MKASKAEKALIGCILLSDRKTLGLCITAGVSADWFDNVWCGKFYSKAVDLFGKGKVVDSVTMDDGKSHYAINDCVDACGTVSYANHYITEVESDYLARKAAQLNKRQADSLAYNGKDIRETIGEHGKQWMELASDRGEERGILEVGNELVDAWGTPIDDTNSVTWPLPNMQAHMGNITDDLIFLCASESTGKTALALQHARYLGHLGIPCSFASLESSLARVLPRLIGQEARINTWPLKNGKGSNGDLEMCRKAIKVIDSLPIRITERPMDVDQLHAWAMAEKANGSRFLIVDNVKHVRTRSSNKGENEIIMEISRRSKWIRDDTGLPVMMLHHLNDDGDVAWAKDIRRDADILLYMTENEELSQQPCQSNDWIGHHINDIKVAKNRDGDRNYILQTLFKKQIQTFDSYKER